MSKVSISGYGDSLTVNGICIGELSPDEHESIEKEKGVRFKFDDIIKSTPAELDQSIIKKLQIAAEQNQLKDTLIPSGAGHDAAIFSNQGVPSGMIFIRNSYNNQASHFNP